MFQYITASAEGLEEVLRGGCRWVQLRMKDASDEEFLAEGRKTADLCRRYGARFILDDRVHLVELLAADGAHLGQNDMGLEDARRILGPGKIIGATANTRAHIDAAVAGGADYIGLGPFRFTTTKKNLSPVLGLEGYRQLLAPGVPVPIVAIGGITQEDIPALMTTGISGVAVAGMISSAPDRESASRALVAAVGA